MSKEKYSKDSMNDEILPTCEETVSLAVYLTDFTRTLEHLTILTLNQKSPRCLCPAFEGNLYKV